MASCELLIIFLILTYAGCPAELEYQDYCLTVYVVDRVCFYTFSGKDFLVYVNLYDRPDVPIDY